jgi:hypothetical protein
LRRSFARERLSDVDRFETPYQPPRRPDDQKRFILKRLLVFLVGFGTIVIFWRIIHPTAPGSVSISISAHAQFAAGAPEKIKVTMNSEHGYPAWDSVDWGDGIKEGNPNRHPTFHGDPCGQYFMPTDGSTPPPIPRVNVGTLPPGKGYIEFLHRYRRPGTYRVTVHADEFGWVCTNQRSPSGSGSILLHVTGPVAPGNGPSDPRPGLVLKLYDYYSRLTGYFGADDPDGYLRSITVTWIDGTTRVYTNHTGCTSQGNIWPSGLLGFRWRQRVKPGNYTVKITALSTDCSGGESQMITLVARFRLTRTGDRIQISEATFIPHKPNGNRDYTLPASELWNLQIDDSVP